MFGRSKKPLWHPSLDALGAEARPQLLAAIYFLKLSDTGLKKLKVSPVKGSLEYEAIVARVAAPSVGRADEQEAREVFDVAHCLRDSRTVLAGSPLSDEPYGDLFYRVLVGYSAVMERLYAQRMGYPPQIDPVNTVEPPHLREFLNETACRFGEAVTGAPPGTWSGDLRGALEELAENHANRPSELIEALDGQPPLYSRMYPAGWQLGYEDILDMTHDAELADAVAAA